MCGCGGKTVEENFNAGNPPLSYGDYPGSEYQGSCGNGAGFGGYGQYGTYGGCPTYDHYNKGSDYDSMDAVHDPGCACPACQVPYSMAYNGTNEDCGCVGKCGCEAGQTAPRAPHQLANVSADVAGHNLVDVGLTDGSGLTAYVQVPFLGVSVNLYQLLRLVGLLMLVSFLAYFLFGFRVRSLF